MEHVEMTEAEKLVRIIRATNNPNAALKAISLRDKWLIEHDIGVLQMNADARLLLELA
jgi:hypothetical protein